MEQRQLAAEDPKQRLEYLRKKKRLAELRAKKTQTEQPNEFQRIDTSSLVSAFPDAVGSLISDMPAMVGGSMSGLGTLGATGDSGAAVDVQQNVTNKLAIQPQTEGGEWLKNAVAFLGEKGIEVTNRALSGLIGLSALATNQGIENANKQMKSVQDDGFLEYLGNSLLEAGAPPAVAAIAKGLPPAALMALGIKSRVSYKPSVSNTSKSLAIHSKPKTESNPYAFQSKKKNLIANQIHNKVASAETARFKLDTTNPDPTMRGVIKDKTAINAIKQGFSESQIASIKMSTPADVPKLLKMLKIKAAGLKNDEYRIHHRAEGVVGESLMDRFKVIKAAKRKAGKGIKAQSIKLKGKYVDFRPAVDKFIQALEDDLGVKVNTQGKVTVDFSNSAIRGVKSATRLVEDTLKRMAGKRTPDAHEVHLLKQHLSTKVKYAKFGKEGLDGMTEFIIKDLRRDINKILGENFPEYGKVNKIYSESKSVIQDLQRLAGRNINLSDDLAVETAGTMTRKIMSNYTGTKEQVKILIRDMDNLAKKNGYKLNDDIHRQVLFADALEDVFGSSGTTTFQNQITRGVKQATSPINSAALVEKVAGGIAKKIEEGKYNQQQAIEAMRELLNEIK